MRPALVPIILADPLPWAKRAEYAWDFLRDRARFAGGYRGALANTPNWTFTRASTGYAQTAAGVLVPFASGELRRTDKGVLIEGARTNILTQSQAATTILSGSNCTLADNVTTAPDATATADSITEAATTTTHFACHTTVNGTSTTTYSFSVFVKANGRNFVLLNLQASANNYVSAVFDLSTGAMTQSSVGGTSGTLTGTAITALADGWYRITLIGTATGPLSFCIGTAPAASGNSFTTLGLVSFLGSTSNSVYIWGWQAEAAAFPSSYIPTTTASATRAADVLSVPVSGINYPLSLYVEFERVVDTGAAEALFDISAGSTTDEAYLQVGSTDLANGIVNATTQQMNATVAGALSVGTTYKVGVRVATNDGIVAKGGALSAQDTSLALPGNPTTIRFGARVNDTAPSFGYLRRAALWTRALTDAELQAVTT